MINYCTCGCAINNMGQNCQYCRIISWYLCNYHMCSYSIMEQEKDNLILGQLTFLLQKMTLNINYIFDFGKESLLIMFCCYFFHKDAKEHFLQKIAISLYIWLSFGPCSFVYIAALRTHAKRTPSALVVSSAVPIGRSLVSIQYL